MIDVLMPSPAEGLDEATIARWLQPAGAMVQAGDDLLEIETDKVTMIHAAEASGILQIVAAESTSVPIGAVIARLATAGEAAEAETETPAQAPASELEPGLVAVGAVTAPEPGEPVRTVARSGVDGVRATPLARLFARRNGIDLASISGSGPYGLVTRADVAGTPVAAVDTRTNGAASTRSTEPVVETLTRMQEVIARRMVEAKTTIPEFQVQTEVVMDAVLAMRTEIKELDDVVVPSVNDFVIKAAALALREHPRVNASFQNGRFLLYPNANVGFAVAAEDALVVPTVFDADTLSLVEIAAETRRLAERVRTGSVTPQDVAGGTFTVSNLGMFGMTAISPIINMPQAAILGVGAARAVPELTQDGVLVSRQLMTLTLTCDHRILYGADAARFLSLVRTLLQQPLRLTLGPLAPSA
jgi:pyruvate dehydrogenase E2 component (dihydrolipoamide acetyltransferase)